MLVSQRDLRGTGTSKLRRCHRVRVVLLHVECRRLRSTQRDDLCVPSCPARGWVDLPERARPFGRSQLPSPGASHRQRRIVSRGLQGHVPGVQQRPRPLLRMHTRRGGARLDLLLLAHDGRRRGPGCPCTPRRAPAHHAQAARSPLFFALRGPTRGSARSELRSARERLAVPSASAAAARPLSRRMGESEKTKGVRVGSRSAVGAGLHGHPASHRGSSSNGGHRGGSDGGLLGLADRRQHHACALWMPTVRLQLLRRATN